MKTRRLGGLLLAVSLWPIATFLFGEREIPLRPERKKVFVRPVQSSLGWADLPGPRSPVISKSEERYLSGDRTDAQLLAEVHRAIHESRNLTKIEAMIRRSLSRRPQYVELNELIGDIQRKRGENEAALASYLASETSENDMGLTPKLIDLYAELRLDDELETYLTHCEAQIMERGTWQNRTAEAIRQSQLAALSVCNARHANEEEASECQARLVMRK